MGIRCSQHHAGSPPSLVPALMALGERSEDQNRRNPCSGGDGWRHCVFSRPNCRGQSHRRHGAPGRTVFHPIRLEAGRQRCAQGNVPVYGHHPCPSIARRWNTGRELTLDDLRALSSKASFVINVEGPCSRRPNVGGPTTVCSSSGTDGLYEYSLNGTSPAKDEKSNVVVFLVEPHR